MLFSYRKLGVGKQMDYKTWKKWVCRFKKSRIKLY